MKRAEKVIIFILILIFIGLIGVLVSLKQGWFEQQDKYLYIYLLFPQKEGSPQLIPVSRGIFDSRNQDGKMEFVIKNLISGPTPEEKKTGFNTNIPSESELFQCWIKDGIAYLDFPGEIEKGGGTLLMKTRLAQIVFTATQFPEIEKVRFLINGKFIKYFSGEGITDVENPIGRDNFSTFKNNGDRI